ncbi:hypothetical protein, partial [Actinomadura logoneensis]|uniref:hypothetical protein n=1 Tax=Actinomadura logoneensis TaxID=2293572 RepID=UPI001A9A2DAD
MSFVEPHQPERCGSRLDDLFVATTWVNVPLARALTERYTDRLAGLDAPLAQCALTYARGSPAAAGG